MQEYPKPTIYRISTITATGSVGTLIDLDILYNSLQISSSEELDLKNNNSIVYIEYGKKKSETIYKGYAKKFSINRRKTKPSKRFDNQVTIVFTTDYKNNINIKVFRNGNVQITGIKSITQGNLVIDNLIEIIKDIFIKNPEIIISKNINNLQNINFKIRLINTDYKVGFTIKREILYKILKNDYGNVCNYEPCIYPGVKLQYYYNINNKLKDGICKCSCNCHDNKGGEGNRDSDCKKITIAIFQSGCIIITGSQTINQIDECYNFINNILYANINKIEKKQIIQPPITKKENNKKILILKSKIII